MKSLSFSKLACILLFAAPAFTGTGLAQSSWNSSPVNGNWNNPDNWDQLPAAGGSTDTVLTFGASSVASLNDDFPGFFTLNSMVFSASAPAFTISSNGLYFRSNQSGTSPSVGMNTNSDVAINNVVQFDSTLTISGAGTGNLTFGDGFTGLAGSSALTLATAGTLTISGTGSAFGNALTISSGTLSITNGSTLSSARDISSAIAVIGNTGSDNGTINVGGGSGSSSWTNNSAIIAVGYNATGALNITGGGSVSGTAGTIGEFSHGVGTVNVGGGTGASSWINLGTLYVGNRGAGTLHITGSGSVRNAAGVIGNTSTGSGVAIVGGGTGSSVWTNTGNLTVGQTGSGTLSVIGGGSVTDATGYIAYDAASKGVVNIGGGTGASSWSNSGNLLVGVYGSGTLNITGGGSVSSGLGSIGDSGSASGAVSVGGGTGASSWTNSSNLYIGNSATGSLTILGGGAVSNTTAYIAYGTTSKGAVNVGGGSGTSTWTNNGNLFVGVYGSGTLNVTGGGAVTDGQGSVGDSAGSSVVNVGGGTGASSWTNSGNLLVGNSGTGVVNITGGGTVSDAVGIIGNVAGGSGTMAVGGGSGTSSWINSAHVVVGQSGNGTLIITGGGSVSNTLGFIAYDNNTVGNVTVGGGSGTSTWINSSSLSVGYSGVATLTINSGGYVQAAGLVDGNSLSSVNFNGGALGITSTGTSTNLLNMQAGGGTINVVGGASTFTVNSVISGTGALAKTGDGTLVLAATNTYKGGTTIQGGVLQATAVNATGTGGVTVRSGAVLAVSAGASISGPVTLSGGNYVRILSGATNNLANAVDSTSSLGGRDTTATLLSGSTANPVSIVTSFSSYESDGVLNDSLRHSDIFSLGITPISGTSTGPFALQLSIGVNAPGAYLGWYNTATHLWENAIDGNSDNNTDFTGSPYAGAFANFQTQYGTNLESYIGAWGYYQQDGVTYTWAVLDHNSDFAVIPEPATWLQLGLGLAVMALFARRRKFKCGF